MNKKVFLKLLNGELGKFDRHEVEGIIAYYEELINDKVEAGMSEEEAVASLGDVKNIVDIVKTDLLVERSKTKSSKGLKNALLILGICASPVLLPIGFTFFIVFAVFFIVYVALIFSFGVSAGACLIGAIPVAVEMGLQGYAYQNIMFGIGSMFFVSGIMTLLVVAIYRIGGKFLHIINKTFSLLIKKVIRGDKAL